ncbi:MYB-like transcription factor ETC2 [Linum perenne]
MGSWSKADKDSISSSSVSQGPSFFVQSHDQIEVSSREWEVVRMNEQEEDLISRMYRLVGKRWDLIAGRIPGRSAEEIERFWIMKHHGRTNKDDHKA